MRLRTMGKLSTATCALMAAATAAGAQQAVDVVIRGGTIYDGSEGNKGFKQAE